MTSSIVNSRLVITAMTVDTSKELPQVAPISYSEGLSPTHYAAFLGIVASTGRFSVSRTSSGVLNDGSRYSAK